MDGASFFRRRQQQAPPSSNPTIPPVPPYSEQPPPPPPPPPPPAHGGSSSPEHHKKKPTIKHLGFKFVNARVQTLLNIARAIAVIPSIVGIYNCLIEEYYLDKQRRHGLFTDESTRAASVRSSELYLASIWCCVSGYLSYSVVDGMMVRWILTYSSLAAVLRTLCFSTLNIAMIQALHSLISPDRTYLLHVWILISCILTVAYIIQDFVTSNLTLERPKRRSIDLYNFAVFAVVPVGVASFLTMLGLLRCLMIVRFDLEQLSSLNT